MCPFQLFKFAGKALFGLSITCWTRCLTDAMIGALTSILTGAGRVLQGLATSSIDLWIGQYSIVNNVYPNLTDDISAAIVCMPGVALLPMAQSIMSNCVSPRERGKIAYHR